MKVGILGTGDVGKALGKGFLALGHEVKIGAREASNEKAQAFVASAGGAAASAGTFTDAARFGEVVVLATLGMANASVLDRAGPDNLRGKVVIDATNPLDFSKGTPALGIAGQDSGGEQVQRLLPAARVVKAFNIVGNAHMFRPTFPGGPPDMFIAGNDPAAKQTVTDLLTAFGWNTIDLGGIEVSRHLEAMCMVWVLYGRSTGSWNHAFKMLRQL
jgi:8-hydroxy-5-deazaflavin:NADPH oxidoreductase